MTVKPLIAEELAPRFISKAGFSISLSRLLITQTFRVELQAEPRAVLQFALAVRRVPIRAELPRIGWCDVGRVMFAPPDFAMPMIVPEGTYDTMGLSYSADMLDEIGLAANWLDRPTADNLNLNSRFLGMDLLRLTEELKMPRFGHAAFVEAAGRVVLYEVAHALSMKVERLPRHGGGLSPWRRRVIMERMESAEVPIPTISELAQLCNLSTRHLMRAFTQETGETLGEMIRRVSVERAKQRLLQAQDPIGKIAVDLGFSSPASFAVAFKRDVGILPSEFRRQAGTKHKIH